MAPRSRPGWKAYGLMVAETDPLRVAISEITDIGMVEDALPVKKRSPAPITIITDR